jgi:signal transduction histidine kinase
MQQENTTEFVIIGTTIIVLLLAATLVFLFLFIQKKQQRHLLETKEAEQRYAHELALSQNEIREKALENISWEIHDNVGQLLSVAIMQLNRLEVKLPKTKQKDLHEVTGIVSKSLKDLRALSKSLNPVSIKKTGLIKAIQMEVDRYNRLNFIKATLKIINKPHHIFSETETILFRIVQEFTNNSIKHAKASELNISLIFNETFLKIQIEDNGVGFDVETDKKGIGLINMKGRAKLINADFDISSKPNQGTSLIIKIDRKK